MSPLSGIYVPKALSAEAAAFAKSWEDGSLMEIPDGFSGDAVLVVARFRGKGERRSFAGTVRIRAWVNLPKGARMATAVPLPPEPPRPFRFKASLRFVGMEVARSA